jgi:hypothetical protein
MKKQIIHFFKNHKQDKVWSTSDGYLFATKHHADAHAGSLKDQQVKEHDRIDFEDEDEDEEVTEPTTSGDGGKKKVKAPAKPKDKPAPKANDNAQDAPAEGESKPAGDGAAQ